MHNYIKFFANSVLVFLFLIVCSNPAHGQGVGLGLNPLRINLQLKPGQIYTDSLSLNSTVDEVARIRGETLDFFLDGDQEPQFGFFEGETQSCRRFLRLNPTNLDLPAKGNSIIRYTFSLPADMADGTYYCAAGLRTIPSPGANGGTGLSVSIRMVAAFFITIGKQELQGGLKQVLIEPDPADPAVKERAICVLNNPGHYVWRPEGTLEIHSADGKLKATIPFRSAPMLPSRDQRFLFPLAVRPEENDELVIRLDIGNKQIQEGHLAVSAARHR